MQRLPDRFDLALHLSAGWAVTEGIGILFLAYLMQMPR
jgi:hypothetical protein